MKNIIIHEAAEAELFEAVEYYEEKAQGLGLDLEEEIRHYLARIQENPEQYPKRNYGTRMCIMKKFPYGIYYIVLIDYIWIVSISHVHRKPNYWKDRLDKR